MKPIPTNPILTIYASPCSESACSFLWIPQIPRIRVVFLGFRAILAAHSCSFRPRSWGYFTLRGQGSSACCCVRSSSLAAVQSLVQQGDPPAQPTVFRHARPGRRARAEPPSPSTCPTKMGEDRARAVPRGGGNCGGTRKVFCNEAGEGIGD